MSYHASPTTKKIDILNIWLVLFSLFIAFKLPFELFLFSYAVLGPLHYLTEINWLKDRNFFISSSFWPPFFAIFGILITFFPLAALINIDFETLSKSITDEYPDMLLLIIFFFSISLIITTKTKGIIISLIFSVFLTFFLNFYLPTSLIFIGLFLPTLVHVYVFTFFFVLHGALKSRSTYGIILAGVLLCVPFIIYYLPFETSSYTPTVKTIETFTTSKMNYVSSTLVETFSQSKFQLLSEIGIRIQVFIAFAYTYHYLNWFSKTSIIGWQKALKKQKTIFIVVLWIASVALYIYDFQIGFIALFFLSFLHVVLEFPLNALTIKELFKRQK